MNNKKNNREVTTGQQQGRWMKSGIAAALASTLLLSGAAHATNIPIPVNATNGQVVYSYDATQTTAEVINLGGNGASPTFCAAGYPNQGGALGQYGLGIRQVTGYSSGIMGNVTDNAPFTDSGNTNPRPVKPYDPSLKTATYLLSAGRVEIYVVDRNRLPGKTTKLEEYSYVLGSGITSASTPAGAMACGTSGAGFMSSINGQRGVYRYPTPDGAVTLTVTKASEFKVHNACQSGGHTGACQRVHNFVASHKR